MTVLWRFQPTPLSLPYMTFSTKHPFPIYRKQSKRNCRSSFFSLYKSYMTIWPTPPYYSTLTFWALPLPTLPKRHIIFKRSLTTIYSVVFWGVVWKNLSRCLARIFQMINLNFILEKTNIAFQLGFSRRKIFVETQAQCYYFFFQFQFILRRVTLTQ